MSYYAHLAAALAAADAAPDEVPGQVPPATIPYTDDFSAVTDLPANGWLPAGQVVDGAASIAGGDLVYTTGAADGVQPRIAREIDVVTGDWYRVQAPAPTGTAADKTVWVSGDGGSYDARLTDVVSNAALDETFQATGAFGAIWVVLRVETGWTAGETARLSEISVTATTEPSVLLDEAELLEIGGSFVTDTEVSLDADVTVSNGDFLVAIFGSRHGSGGETHNSLTPSGFTCSFSKATEDEQVDASFPTAMRQSIWTGTVTAGGTGSVTGVTSSTTWQRGLILLRVPGGDSVAQTAIGGSSTGTGNSIAWSATPDAAGLSIGAGSYQGNPSPALADHAAIVGAVVDSNSNILLQAWQKLNSPPDPLSFSGATNDQTRVVGAVNIIGA